MTSKKVVRGPPSRCFTRGRTVPCPVASRAAAEATRPALTVVVPDTNLLLYAVDATSPHHAGAKRWLDALLGGDEPVGFPWAVLLGFVRISMNARIMQEPLELNDALYVVSLWMHQPVVVTVKPGAEHWSILLPLLLEARRGGNLTTDAHLAALCIERGATLASADGGGDGQEATTEFCAETGRGAERRRRL